MLRKTWIGVSLGLVLAASSAQAAGEEHFLQISPVKAKVPLGEADGQILPNLYWKFVVDGDNIAVYDLCASNGNQPPAAAKGTAKAWTLGDQRAEIDQAGRLSIKVGNSLYATGNEIKPIVCDEATKIPTSQPELLSPATLTLRDARADVAPSSGFEHLQAARGKTLLVTRAVTPTPGKPDTTEAIPAGTLTCKTAPATAAGVKPLVDSPALVRNPQFWPGNLVRGQDLANGQFTPITAKRAAGTLTISGVVFESPDAAYSVDIEGRMTNASVTQAINKLLSQKIKSTQANASFTVNTVYSSDQLAFALGVDGRFSQGSFATSLNVDTSSKKNNILARFTQIYYTVSFEDPESMYSVFFAGKSFEDDEDQIGADNPPLYVSQIGYGRSIYFLASSTDSATAVKAALEGAYGNKDAGNYIGVNTSATYKSVMANTSVSYFVLGGDAATAVTPIKSDDPQKMYDAVKAVIADQASAEVGDSNRGLPISYNLNYLTNRAPASLGYATSYDQTDCTIIPTGYYSFSMMQTCVDDSVTVSVIDQANTEKALVKMDGGFSGHEFINLDQFLPPKDENAIIRILEYNIAGPWCSNFKFKRTFKDPKTDVLETLYLQGDGTLGPSEYEIRRSGGWLVGNQSDFKIQVNRASGTVQVLSR